MLDRLSIAAPSASRTVAVARDSEPGVGCDSDDGSDWFGQIARGLLGKDAGFGLHLATGAPEGSCYKYVTRQPGNRRQPPGAIIRDLLRTDGGYQWLAAIMDGSDAEWWRELQRARRIADAIAAVE